MVIRTDAAATLKLRVGPECDLGMGLGKLDELPEHGGLEDCVIVQEPDSFGALHEGPFCTEVAARTEAGVSVGGEQHEMGVDALDSRSQSSLWTMIDEDHAVGEGFVLGE
jgi:hypothetical protein